jgi:hypothetical protein
MVYSPMTIIDHIRPNAAGTPPRLLVLVLPLAIAIALAVVGAFGSYVAMELPVRLLHFLAIGLAIGTLAFGLSAFLRRYVFAGALPFWASVAVASAIAPAGGLLVQQALTISAPHALRHVSFSELTGQVLLVNLVVGTVSWLLLRPAKGRVESPAQTRPEQADDAAREIRTKLPVAQRQAKILALSAEDHYVRVHTDRGQALILINLSRAVDALGPDTGVRIHRSYWVANAVALQMTGIGRKGLRLDDTTVFPVSRAGRRLLKEFRARSAGPCDASATYAR